MGLPSRFPQRTRYHNPANRGIRVLIVAQKVREVLKIADRVYVLRNGRVSFTGPAGDLHDDAKLREVYL
jgi:branched-chain amino acid transport system ATP-binding protein